MMEQVPGPRKGGIQRGSQAGAVARQGEKQGKGPPSCRLLIPNASSLTKPKQKSEEGTVRASAARPHSGIRRGIEACHAWWDTLQDASRGPPQLVPAQGSKRPYLCLQAAHPHLSILNLSFLAKPSSGVGKQATRRLRELEPGEGLVEGLLHGCIGWRNKKQKQRFPH